MRLVGLGVGDFVRLLIYLFSIVAFTKDGMKGHSESDSRA